MLDIHKMFEFHNIRVLYSLTNKFKRCLVDSPKETNGETVVGLFGPTSST